MKLKMSDIVKAIPTFNFLAEKDIPVQTACDVYDIVQILEPHLATFRKMRKKIMDKYEVPTDKGMQVADDKKEAFEAESEELMNREIDVNIPFLHPDGFGDLKLSYPLIGAIRFAFPPRPQAAPDLPMSKEGEDE